MLKIDKKTGWKNISDKEKDTNTERERDIERDRDNVADIQTDKCWGKKYFCST